MIKITIGDENVMMMVVMIKVVPMIADHTIDQTAGQLKTMIS